MYRAPRRYNVTRGQKLANVRGLNTENVALRMGRVRPKLTQNKSMAESHRQHGTTFVGAPEDLYKVSECRSELSRGGPTLPEHVRARPRSEIAGKRTTPCKDRQHDPVPVQLSADTPTILDPGTFCRRGPGGQDSKYGCAKTPYSPPQPKPSDLK